MKRVAYLLIPVLALLAACAPGASVVAPPEFRLVSARLLRVEPPGVGAGEAVVRFDLEAINPNPVGLRLAALDGDLALGGRSVAATRLPEGLDLPARGSARIVLDVAAPVAGAPHLLAQVGRLIGGEGVPFRLDATLAVDVLGVRSRFPAVTVARGELPPLPPLAPPTVRVDPASSAVRLEGLTAVIDIGLEVDNPSVLGFEASAPQVEVRLGGRTVGRAGLPLAGVPARGRATAVLRIEAGVGELGAALLARLEGGAGDLEVVLAGPATFAFPGLASFTVDLAGVGGALR